MSTLQTTLRANDGENACCELFVGGDNGALSVVNPNSGVASTLWQCQASDSNHATDQQPPLITATLNIDETRFIVGRSDALADVIELKR